MTLPDVFFSLFSSVMVGSALVVILARNPVHAVLFLILAFVNAAGLFLLLGAEFLSMILVVVYVGAVAVLFLFVVMMLDVDFVQLREGFARYAPLGIMLGTVVSAELIFALIIKSFTPEALQGFVGTPTPERLSNTEALGQVLYTQYIYIFQGEGFVLLTAMVGAIVLTLRHRSAVKRQNTKDQNRRTAQEAVSLRNTPSGKGLSGV